MFELRPVERPYPGLRPFEAHESEIFFGREGHTDRLLEILQRERFLAVIGPSGGGKSSLVRAGLLPGLAAGSLGSGSHWRLALFRPGAQPLLALAQALLTQEAFGPELLGDTAQPAAEGEFSADAALLAAQLRQGLPGLQRFFASVAARRAADAPPLNLLILADQFEEIFTYRSTQDDPDEARAFVDLLLAAPRMATPPLDPPRVHVALTMRTDFLGHCVFFADLPEAINRAQYLTPRLKRDEMRAAICGPARVFEGEVDADFAEAIITQVGSEPDQLPLLQHALARWWELASTRHPDAPRIDASCTETKGTVDTALNKHAEELFAALKPQQQEAAEALFRAITEGREGAAAVRRPQRLDQIAAWSGLREDDLKKVIQHFAHPEVSFLHHGKSLDPHSLIDLSHEALMRQWARLQLWVEDEFKRGQHYARWSKRAREHRDEQSGLLQGADLARALEWWNPGREGNAWTPTPAWASLYSTAKDAALAEEFTLTQKFLEDSRDAEQREREQEQLRLEEEARREKERADHERDIATKARRIARAMIVLALATLYLAYAAWTESHRAQSETARAEGARQQAEAATQESQANLAKVQKAEGDLKLALEESEARKRKLAESLTELQESEHARAASLRQAQQAEQSRTASLFDSQLTHASLLARGEDFAEARRVLAQSALLDKAIPPARRHARNLLAGYVDIRGGQAEQVYTGAGAALVGGLAVSPDGKWLVAAGERGTLVIFDAHSGTLLRRLEGHDPKAGTTGSVLGIAIDPQGSQVYSAGDDGRVIRWSLPGGDKLAEWTAGSVVWALALSPDGKTLATGGRDGVISLWSLPQGTLLRRLEGHEKSITGSSKGLSFSPDGLRLASASFDKSVRIWDVASGQSIHVLKGHSEASTGVAFSPDGRLLASSSLDQRILLWDTEQGTGLRILQGHQNWVLGIGFSPDGRQLYSSSRDGSLRLWDVASGTTLRTYQGHEAGLWSVVRHGSMLYTASDDGSLRRWSAATPGQWLWDTGTAATAAAVAPDGSHVAVGLKNGAIRLYALPDGRLLAEVPDAHHNQIIRLAFSPDGKQLASGSHDDTAKIWQVHGNPGAGIRLQVQHTLSTHRMSVHGVAFSPDGRLLATASYDGRIGVFDSVSGQRQTVPAHQGPVLSAVFDARGEKLLSAGRDDFRLRLWNPRQLQQPPRELARTQDIPLWASFSPDAHQVAVVGRGSNVTLLDLAHPDAPIRLAGHENAVFRAHYSPDGQQLATVGGDMTVRLWDVARRQPLFVLRLPANPADDGPWDFDFRCTSAGECWIAVPLVMGRVAVYRLPYESPPPSLTRTAPPP